MSSYYKPRLSDVEIEHLKARDDFLARVSRWVPDLKRAGNSYMGTCPIHGGRSFNLVPGKRFAHCHGCGRHWDPIAWIREFERPGCSFAEALAELGGDVDRGVDPAALQAFERAEKLRQKEIARKNEDKRKKAYAVFGLASPIAGTDAEEYLIGRGLRPPFPGVLGFDPKLTCRWSYEDESGKEHTRSVKLPSLIAALQASDGRFATIHRIYLERRPDGSIGKAFTPPPDAVKKLHGSPLDGAVRLDPPRRVLCLAEGIETALAVRQALADHGKDDAAVWATISAGGLARLGLGDYRPERIVIFGDFDKPDKRGVRPGHYWAERAVARFQSLGVPATARFPDREGLDWLDVLIGATKGKAA